MADYYVPNASETHTSFACPEGGSKKQHMTPLLNSGIHMFRFFVQCLECDHEYTYKKPLPNLNRQLSKDPVAWLMLLAMVFVFGFMLFG
ncbi:hypothetical protein [Herpetosiphon geysericola]|uniref:Uncharacterized protein n=1 Tax=Herpetosiphon geysericola TaxID=70996 RepID=A0A0P6YZD7_9CHLR|nr:hypothetical protein [Herpetosiphon geysericola]KPL90589.1 hypothetical protein SE18_05795 [Herpetosiphon geysericola]